ncbi:MAG TPA: hypothetical protein DSN98_04075 [Thermoplasmata archaeon]|jgi:hypothetical protein|nr:MAG TPA: hypothetical protein DSN98_04075 [Thermoplasmata archaeon]
MRNTHKVRSFLNDERAVSEEFTVLPALSIVMIGFALFIALLAQTYMAYAEHMNQLQNYQTTDGILQKLTNPDSYFIKEGGAINLSVLQNNTGPLQALCEQYNQSGISFLIRLSWKNITQDFPTSLLASPQNRIAVSKNIAVYLNEAQTTPATLSVLLWRESR